LRFRPYVTQVHLLGVPYRFLIADRSAQGWYTNPAQNANPHLRWLVERLVRTGDVVLHCGAHHGLLTLPLAARVGPEGRVYCVEPHRRNAGIIRRNARMNGMANVQVLVRVIAGCAGPVRVLSGSHNSLAGGDGGHPTHAARASTLDGLLAEFGIRPTVVLLDLGGLEVVALRASPVLRAMEPRMAIEVHPADVRRHGAEPNSLFELLPPAARLFAQPASGAAPVGPVTPATAPDVQYELYVLPAGGED
jgi:FkbM family methyltransferase